MICKCQPFWRIWNSAGSDGRGVIGILFFCCEPGLEFICIVLITFPSCIGVLEADFIEPAHDKQGFERTTVLAKLEGRLLTMQKTYWCVPPLNIFGSVACILSGT